MSEYFFGVGRGQLRAEVREKINALASTRDSYIINTNTPGEGWRYWFAGPNRGEPFDSSMKLGVMDKLRAAGFADSDNNLLAHCFVPKGVR